MGKIRPFFVSYKETRYDERCWPEHDVKYESIQMRLINNLDELMDLIWTRSNDKGFQFIPSLDVQLKDSVIAIQGPFLW